MRLHLTNKKEIPGHKEKERHDKAKAHPSEKELDGDADSILFGASVRLQVHGLLVE